jgi:hypothetical protein
MSDTQDLQELEVDLSQNRVRYGQWHWKLKLEPGSGAPKGVVYQSTSHYNGAPLYWKLSPNEKTGSLVVVKKTDAAGHYHDHYYLQPSSSMLQGQQIAVTAVKHDSQGTIHWMDTNGNKFVSAGSNENTCLLFDPGYQTAGTLLHSNGEYYLNQTSCSQRGSCAGGCRCNDCPTTGAHMQTDEDFETQVMSISNFAKKAAEAARKGLAIAGKGLAAAGKAAQKGLELANAEGKKTVAALKQAHKAYNDHRNAQGDSQSENHINHQEQADSHLEDALREEEKAKASLNIVDTANLSPNQKQQFKNNN